MYTCYRDIEVMFHVAPLLPHFADDHQQIEKKRHLGNDVCLLIFREEGVKEPFSPLKIRSQFNHVFVIVQADRSSGSLRYRVACTNKPGVAKYGPPIPASGNFDPVADKEHLHGFFCAKRTLIFMNLSRYIRGSDQWRALGDARSRLSWKEHDHAQDVPHSFAAVARSSQAEGFLMAMSLLFFFFFVAY